MTGGWRGDDGKLSPSPRGDSLAATQKGRLRLQYGGRCSSQAKVKGFGMPFLDERPQFEQELDAFYATYPSDVSHIIREMDEASTQHPE